MPAPPKALLQDDRENSKGQKAFERALMRWMLRRARVEAKREINRQLGKVEKADPVDRELVELLRRFGMARAGDAMLTAAATTEGLERVIDPQDLRREMRRLQKEGPKAKGFKLKWYWALDGWFVKRAKQLSAETRNMVKESVSKIIDEALSEVPRPSTGEIARRIRTQFHGEDPKGRVFAFSPERAAVIARTELQQIVQPAKNEGYKLISDIAQRKGHKTKKRWLAYRDDRSGKRHHEKMHNVEVDVDEYFVTPKPFRDRIKYPGDPSAKIRQTINCRCSHRLVISKG